MEKDSQAAHALIPDHENRDLSLPAEMAQRGLELALHIEQKQGIQPLQSAKEYTVRCQVEAMQWIRKEDASYRLGASDQSITGGRPVYLVLSVDHQGVHVSCASRDWDFIGMDGNEDRFRQLNVLQDLNPFTIPVDSLGLYYNLVSQDEKLESIFFTMGPSGGAPGYKGPITRDANRFYNERSDCVETVLIYISVLRDPEDGQSYVRKAPPLKLRFMAIDQNGKNDLHASRELYHTLLETKEPGSTQRGSMSIQDLYQNAPASTSDQKNWRQWELTYEGKYVKDNGRFESISIHPKEGKLFMIMNVSGSKVAPGQSTTQVALWVEDVHGLQLGEKEGSFLLESMRWIQLGETYAFQGRAFKYGWLDGELGSTDFRNLIIVKVKLKDIIAQG